MNQLKKFPKMCLQCKNRKKANHIYYGFDEEDPRSLNCYKKDLNNCDNFFDKRVFKYVYNYIKELKGKIQNNM